jgi:hypothetical protein
MDPFRPLVWLLAAVGMMAIVGALYMKVMERGIDAAMSTNDRQASFGEIVRVGDIDLTVMNVARHSPGGTRNVLGQPMTLSTPNFVVQVEATNARGARSHDFSPLSLKVVDDAGVVHEAVACPQCPGQAGGGLPTTIVKGGTLEASYYFKLPSQALPASVLYKPIFSRDTATIDVRGAVR